MDTDKTTRGGVLLLVASLLIFAGAAVVMLQAVTVFMLSGGQAVTSPRIIPAYVGAAGDTIAAPVPSTPASLVVPRPDRSLLDESPIGVYTMTNEERMAAFRGAVQGQLPVYKPRDLVLIAQAQCTVIDQAASAEFAQGFAAAVGLGSRAGLSPADAATLAGLGVPAFCPVHWQGLVSWVGGAE